MSERMTSADRIGFAQDFFRFAYRVGSPISFGIKFDLPDPPDIAVFGKHSFVAADYEMSEEAFELCGALLERLAYRLLAMELNIALEKKFGSWKVRSCHPDELIRNASIVVWMIRNAVAHNILEPVWKIADPMLQDRKFVVADVLAFDTTGLNGKLLQRHDFGGPLALFRLSERLSQLLS
jgi:hypothetical protein